MQEKSLKELTPETQLLGAVVMQGQTVGCSCPTNYCGMRCETYCDNGGKCVG